MTFQAETVTVHKGDLIGWKGLVKVTFNSAYLNLKGPISKTFKLSKGVILRSEIPNLHFPAAFGDSTMRNVEVSH